MSAFDRLSPALGYQIVNTLGFRELYPVQLAAIDVVLDGKNAVILAPTAGGKTEAAFFPLLSAMDTEGWRPVSLLYLSPLRALINDQEGRIRRYASTLGRRVFTWHGDVGPPARKRFLEDPADILLTTPESLEAMLMSPRQPARRLFSRLRAVIVDEVHAFAGDDRGAHLAALLERVSRYCGRDLQRLGLSATVGNPDQILGWLAGSSERPGAVVDPPRDVREAQLVVDYVGSLENAARVIAQLHRGRKRLVFVDSRRRVERLTELLREQGVETFLTHGALAAGERRAAERAFREGPSCVIVATSALELGIDVGDLDHVVQIDAPGSVASFLQRLGRTGRRRGATANCTFLATGERALLGAAAIIALFRSGYVEPIRPSRRAAHILAHQLLALAVQERGVAAGDWQAWLAGATPFLELSAEDRRELVEHMIAQGILADHDGRLWLGPQGERRYGRRRFAELYAVFQTPRLITVRWDAREIGSVDAGFLEALDESELGAAFVLAGRPWQVVDLDWRRGGCVVRPAAEGRAARWPGVPQFLGYEMCQAMRRVLTATEDDPSYSRRACRVLARLRSEHAFLRDAQAAITGTASALTWWSFGGGRANLLLARMIEAELGGRCVVRNTSIRWQGSSGNAHRELRRWLGELAAAGRPHADDAMRFARLAARRRLSKFQPCLPEKLLDGFLVDHAFDLEGASRCVRALGAPA